MHIRCHNEDTQKDHLISQIRLRYCSFKVFDVFASTVNMSLAAVLYISIFSTRCLNLKFDLKNAVFLWCCSVEILLAEDGWGDQCHVVHGDWRSGTAVPWVWQGIHRPIDQERCVLFKCTKTSTSFFMFVYVIHLIWSQLLELVVLATMSRSVMYKIHSNEDILIIG